MAYEDGAGDRLALIRKMYDPGVVVFKTRPGRPDEKKGPLYFDAAQNPRQRATGSGTRAGDTALYTASQARDLGRASRRPEFARRRPEHLPPAGASLYHSLERAGAWRSWSRARINGELKEKVQRRVRRALGQKANLLIFQLACGDGESQTAHEVGLFLAGLNDSRPDRPVETVAFVTNQARNTAAFLAFGCNKIVMQREVARARFHPAFRRLGDFDRYMQGHPTLEPVMHRNLAEVAAETALPVAPGRGHAQPRPAHLPGRARQGGQ